MMPSSTFCFLAAQGRVFSLRVVGQESNVVLLARKKAQQPAAMDMDPAEDLEAMRAQLRLGAASFAHLAKTESATELLCSMNSNTETLTLYDYEVEDHADCNTS